MPTLSDVWDEICSTDQDWLDSIEDGDATEVDADSRTQYVATSTQRDLVQKMGEAYGCHSCNKYIKDTTQLFIVDHIPPRGVFGAIGANRARYRFYAHCDVCALEQAALVRDLKILYKDAWKAVLAWRGWGKGRKETCRKELEKAGLNPKQISLLIGGVGFNFEGHANLPRSSDRAYLNLHARRCHTCNRKQANFVYHADHCPPKEFAMSGWFSGFLAAAPDPDRLRDDIAQELGQSFFRPQCPHCSHRQGGRVNKIVITAQREMGLRAMTTKTKRGRRIKLRKYGR